MKGLVCILALAVSAAATAATVGYLLRDDIALVGGKVKHQCLYDVGTDKVSILLDKPCPNSYKFD